jgi:hypothetical protein
MKTYQWVIAICLVLALGLSATSANAQGIRSASLTITTPTPNPVKPGVEFVFNLVISAENIIPGLTGADIYLQFDPVLVAPPVAPAVVAEALPDFFGISNVSVNEITQCPGSTNTCVHLVVAGLPKETHTGIVARFHFQGIKGGQACFSVLASSLVDADGFAVEHTPAQAQCVSIVEHPTVTGTALRQGVPANPNAGTPACTSISIIGQTTVTTFTDSAGVFSLSETLPDTYLFRASYPGYLTSEKANYVVADGVMTLNAGSTTLRGGDVNGDNAINILDIGTIISKFGKIGFATLSTAANCVGTDEPADINDDGVVNISDLAIAVGNWGLTGPTVWP